MIRNLSIVGCLILLIRTVTVAGEEPSSLEKLTIGVSQASFGRIHPNDANAALKAWADAVVREGGLKIDVQVQILETMDELRAAVARNSIQAVSLSSEEFFLLGDQPEFVFLNAKVDSCSWQYVIVARHDGGVDSLPALRGRRMVRHVSPATIPALAWLETVIGNLNQGRSSDFLAEMAELESASKTVLRVFFRQSDACLVTSQAFDLACELNPILRRQLGVLASSPPLISGVFYFRNSYQSPSRSQLEAAVLRLHTTTAGQQVLTVFQGSRMEKHPVSSLDPTRRLYERRARLAIHAGLNAPVDRPMRSPALTP